MNQKSPLEELLAEVRSATPPKVDSARIKRHALAALMEEPSRAQRITEISGRETPSPRRWQQNLSIGSAVMAAALGLGLIGHALLPNQVPERRKDVVVEVSGEAPTAQARTAANETAQQDAVALQGERLTTAQESRTLTFPGRASFTLEAHSSAWVTAVDPVLHVQLLSGALVAQVQKSAHRESFVVKVEHALVSVHGTLFRVAYEPRPNATEFSVQVSEGIVSVRDGRENAASKRELLVAPAFFRFALGDSGFSVVSSTVASSAHRPVSQELLNGQLPLNGQAPLSDQLQLNEQLPLNEQARGELGRVFGPKAGSGVPQAAGNQTPLSSPLIVPSAPLDFDAQDRFIPGTEGVLTAARRCFEKSTPATGSTKVRVQTMLTLSIDREGRLVAATFEPPLSPLVAGCVDQALLATKFPGSSAGATVRRSVVFEH